MVRERRTRHLGRVCHRSFFRLEEINRFGRRDSPRLGLLRRGLSGQWNRRSLAQMIEFAEKDDVRERANRLGAAMADEKGIVAAVEAIEALVAGSVEVKK